MILDALETWNQMWYKIGQFFMTPDDSGVNYLTRILISIGLIIIGWIIIKVFGMILRKVFGVKRKGPQIDVSAKFFVIKVIEVFLWIGVALLVISTLKFDVTGVAGIASAVTVALGLALQDVIACFAYGILLLQQKNFIAGDYISVQNAFGSCEGTVESVHFFFTYLHTINGQEITIPNNNMAKAVVTNYTKLGKRRTNFEVGIAYDSDIALAKKVMMEIAKSDPRVLKDPEPYVYVLELGAYAVTLRLRCWLKVEDYWPFYYELAEKVLLAFRENGIYIPSSTDRQIMKAKDDE